MIIAFPFWLGGLFVVKVGFLPGLVFGVHSWVFSAKSLWAVRIRSIALLFVCAGMLSLLGISLFIALAEGLGFLTLPWPIAIIFYPLLFALLVSPAATVGGILILLLFTIGSANLWIVETFLRKTLELNKGALISFSIVFGLIATVLDRITRLFY